MNIILAVMAICCIIMAYRIVTFYREYNEMLEDFNQRIRNQEVWGKINRAVLNETAKKPKKKNKLSIVKK